jgi:predicted Ser/Thr protein kinase
MIIERIRKPIENNMCITKGSTPVIYFGDYDSAKACTISLNPSNREFLDTNGEILTGNAERLCSRKTLGKMMGIY